MSRSRSSAPPTSGRGLRTAAFHDNERLVARSAVARDSRGPQPTARDRMRSGSSRDPRTTAILAATSVADFGVRRVRRSIANTAGLDSRDPQPITSFVSRSLIDRERRDVHPRPSQSSIDAPVAILDRRRLFFGPLPESQSSLDCGKHPRPVAILDRPRLPGRLLSRSTVDSDALRVAVTERTSQSPIDYGVHSVELSLSRTSSDRRLRTTVHPRRRSRCRDPPIDRAFRDGFCRGPTVDSDGWRPCMSQASIGCGVPVPELTRQRESTPDVVAFERPRTTVHATPARLSKSNAFYRPSCEHSAIRCFFAALIRLARAHLSDFFGLGSATLPTSTFASPGFSL